MGIAFLGLLCKEIVQFFRDRLILVLILWLYTIEVVICTVALSFDVSHLPDSSVTLSLASASSFSSSRTEPIPTLPPTPSMMLCKSFSARNVRYSTLLERRGAQFR